MTTATKEKTKAPVKPTKDKDDEVDDREAFKRSRKPPAEGPCKRCGKDRPLNRLFLCYPCWVKVRLEERGWREGMPHPDGCGCDLDCKLEKQGGQN